MLIKTESSKAIIDFLKEELLINLNTIGIIENLPEAEIYVDNVENPKGVYVSKGYFKYIYSKEDNFINEVMDTFIQDGFYGFAGIDASIAEKIKERYLVSWENPCALYYLPKENLDLSLIKNPVRDIDIKDVEIIDKYYEFRHPESIDAIRKDIELRPSSAVYIDGEPVCWVLVHDDNSMGIMYTREEYRRKGYAVDVTIDLAAKIYERGNIPYLQIINRNNMSPGLAKKCNFANCGYVNWFGIIAGLPKDFVDINRESRRQFFESVSGIEEHMPSLSSDYEELYFDLDKPEKAIDTIDGFSFQQVENEEIMKAWSKVVCEGKGLIKEQEKNVKELLINLYNNPSYKLYVGYLDGTAVSASVLHKAHEEVDGMYLTSTVPSCRNEKIGTLTVIETLKASKEDKKGLLIMQSPKEQVEFFKELGFVTSFNK